MASNIQLRVRLFFLLCAFLAVAATRAGATPVGTGTLINESQGDGNGGAYFCALTTFDNVTDDVFGTPINLGTDVGALLCTGHFDPTTGVTAHCTSTPDPSKLTLDASGPAPPGSSTPFPGQQQPFVVTPFNVTGTVATAIGNATYTFDGTQTMQADPNNPQQPKVLLTNDISGCSLTGPVAVFLGDIGMNAFQAVATATGSDVPVSTSATYTNPYTNMPDTVAIDLSFSSVSTAGTTTVTATSNVAGQISSNFSLSAGGLLPTFFDVSTTAVISGPITICQHYPDADNDGIVDGTTVAETDLRILHGEGSNPIVFVDRTFSLDTVNNIICAQTTSLSPFVIAAQTATPCSGASFAGRRLDALGIPDGTNIIGPAVGDLNGDGKLDVVLTAAPVSTGNPMVIVLPGAGDGTFGRAIVSPAGATDFPQFTVLGDLNGDGKLDVAYSDCLSETVSIMLGHGDGSFGAPTPFPLAVGCDVLAGIDLALADLNGDGKLDLAAIGSGGNLSILLGHGDGSFAAPLSSGAQYVAPFAVGDFNGDHKLDIVDRNNVALGNGDGSFGAPQPVISATNTGPVLGDFNGDGKLDIAGVDSATNIEIALGHGDGSFDAAIKTQVGTSKWFTYAMAAGDLNSDGKLDLVLTGGPRGSAPKVIVLLGHGDGHFDPSMTVPADFPVMIAMGDFNGDSRADLVVPPFSTIFSLTSSPVDVLINNSCDESGFIPQDANTAKCEDAVAKNIGALGKCMAQCQVKQANATLVAKPFDEDACEQGTGKPLSCRAKYDNANATLLAKNPAICPACLTTTVMSTLADNSTTFFNAHNGQIYCSGTTNFGGDDPGMIPPDADTAKCENGVANNLAKFGDCIRQCHNKQADAALKGKAFDEESCEEGLGRPLSCRAKYNNANAKLLLCPLCLTGEVMTTLADQLMSQLEANQQSIYCAGTMPLPVP